MNTIMNTIKKFVSVFILLTTISIPTSADTLFTPIAIPMRDGKALAADIYSLDTLTAKPVILIQTPYNKNMYRYYSCFIDTADTSGLWDLVHYQIVIVDWRGYYGSAAAGSLGYDRGLDGYDCVEWIAAKDWCDGKVGTYGGSALGKIQFLTARQHPPHLVCAAPWIADYQTQYSDYYYGGVYRKEHVEFHESHGFSTTALILSHPTYDITWQYVEANSDYPDEFDIPMLMLTGWFDIFPDDIIAAFHNVRAESEQSVRDKHKIIVGPWTHSNVGKLMQGELEYPAAENAEVEPTKKFFDIYLRNVNNGYEDEPVGRYFIMGADEWVETDDWYSLTDYFDTLYLHADASLSELPPTVTSSYDSFLSDPRDPCPAYGGARLDEGGATAGPWDQTDTVENRTDILLYSTPVLSDNLTIIGPVSVRLYVSSNCLDTDISIRLCDVYPDGRSMLITQGIRRMRFRDGFSESDIALMTPGEVYPLTVELRNLAMTFTAGHKLRIIISASCYPVFDINLNNGGKMYAPGDTLIATNYIHHDATYKSTVLLPESSAYTKIPDQGRTCQTPNSKALHSYPNPFSYSCKITLPKDAPTTGNEYVINIFDLNGVLIYTEKSDKSSGWIWCPDKNIQSGIYYITVNSNDGRHYSQKVLYLKSNI